jgi:hypothetical protein
MINTAVNESKIESITGAREIYLKKFSIKSYIKIIFLNINEVKP